MMIRFIFFAQRPIRWRGAIKTEKGMKMFHKSVVLLVLSAALTVFNICTGHRYLAIFMGVCTLINVFNVVITYRLLNE